MESKLFKIESFITFKDTKADIINMLDFNTQHAIFSIYMKYEKDGIKERFVEGHQIVGDVLFDKKEFNDSFDSENTNLTNEYKNHIEENKTENLILLKDIIIRILKREHIGKMDEVGRGKTYWANAFINNLKVFPKND